MEANDWCFEHTVEARVAPEAAWAFWIDVSNWSFDTSLEWVRLDGPFAAGTLGHTKPRDAPAFEWRIGKAASGHAVIEVPFGGAVATFEWRFLPGTSGGTRIAQRVRVRGADAAEHVAALESELARGLPQGMARLAERMEERCR